MTTLKLKGVHGTCITHAKSILSRGVQPSTAGRAGSGFYLWAFLADPSRARELAEDWHRWRLDKGAYDDCSERGLAILTFEIEVSPRAYVNLNQARHHEMLRTIQARMPPDVDQSKVYDDYICGLSEQREKTDGTPLKVVEAMVPFPQATKMRMGGPALTPGADAYIVLNQGLSDLRVTDCWPVGLRR
jgi:hypothetical protein